MLDFLWYDFNILSSVRFGDVSLHDPSDLSNV